MRPPCKQKQFKQITFSWSVGKRLLLYKSAWNLGFITETDTKKNHVLTVPLLGPREASLQISSPEIKRTAS